MSRQKTAGILAGRPPGLATSKKPLFFHPRSQRGTCFYPYIVDQQILLCARDDNQRDGPLLLLFHTARTPSPHPDPKRGAQDVRRFPTEPWMASRKIPAISPVAV